MLYFSKKKLSHISNIFRHYSRVHLHSKAHLFNSFRKLSGNSSVSGSRSARILSTKSLVTLSIFTMCAWTVRGCIMYGLTLERKSYHILPWLKAREKGGERKRALFNRRGDGYIVRNLRRPLCVWPPWLSVHSLDYRPYRTQGRRDERKIDR